MTWPCAMVDLETLGMAPGGAILRVGIVPFSLEHGAERVSLRHEWLDVGCSREANEDGGREIDPDTVDWWSRQSPEAVAALSVPPVHRTVGDLKRCVVEFLAEVQRQHDRPLVLWAKPPTFDLDLLRDLVGKVDWPIKYWNERCLRTLISVTEGLGLPGPSEVEKGTAHSAVEDAAWQARQTVYLVREVRRLGRT